MAEPTMLERVAVALAAEDGRGQAERFYLSAARVAIAEMRRPTTEMRRKGDESRAAGATADTIYMVMTDEAAREPS